MRFVTQISLCVVLISVYSNGDEVPPSIKAKLHQHLQSSRWFWKLAGSHVKTVHPVSFKVNVVSIYNVTKISKAKGVFQNGNKYRDCATILKKNPDRKGKDGVYTIYLAGNRRKKVYCDMTTKGGGWTAIQRRQDGSTDFYRTWSEYKQGFGDPSKNYWIGNEAIFELTKNKGQELRVELQRYNGDKAYAHYSKFYVGNEGSKYKLTVSGYSGTAGDSLKYHKEMKFTTKDQDNDRNRNNCATLNHGAWWYYNCHYSNLNGQYAKSALSGYQYPVWHHWKSTEALKQTMMMIRHKN